MYILLGLLFLCLKIIDGVIIQCPMGGISNDEELCQKLIESSFQREISVNEDSTFDAYDIPYYSFDSRTKEKVGGEDLNIIQRNLSNNCVCHYIFGYIKECYNGVSTVNSQLNEFDPLDSMTKSVSHDADQAKLLENKRLLRKIIFRQSLLLNAFIPIKTAWYETLSIGTDTYITKFHNKLLSKYKGAESTISFKDYMVFIQSYYNAASTYYFSRRYDIAMKVIEEGIQFSRNVYNYNGQFKHDEKVHKGEMNVWIWLCMMLKQDIGLSQNTIMESKTIKLSDIDKDLKSIALHLVENTFFPSSVVLFYRSYFLDNQDEIEGNTKQILVDWAKKINPDSIDKDIMYTKNISMYSFLVLFTFSDDHEVKLKNITKAIQWPVLSIEDRLLNYTAIKLAEQFLALYLDSSELLCDTLYCKKIEENLKQNHVLRKTIVPKLTNMYYYEKNNKHLIDKLFENLLNSSTVINERILHVIVTAAIEIVDTSSSNYEEKYRTHIRNLQNIKQAIHILNHYLNGQAAIKKEIENNKTEQNNQSIHNEEIYTDDITDTADLNKREKMDKLYKIKYSTDEESIQNIFIGSKWLAELTGALCNNSTFFQNELKHYIETAELCFKSLLQLKIITNDDHLKYLKIKQDAKILLADNSFEVLTWPGGWHFSNLNTKTSNTSDHTADSIRQMFDELNSLRNSDCPYINKIELNILLYRLYIYMNKVHSDYNQMYQYIKSAIDYVVVTTEDRVRNLEAHELFSMFLMMRNRNTIKKAQTKIGAQIDEEDTDSEY